MAQQQQHTCALYATSCQACTEYCVRDLMVNFHQGVAGVGASDNTASLDVHPFEFTSDSLIGLTGGWWEDQAFHQGVGSMPVASFTYEPANVRDLMGNWHQAVHQGVGPKPVAGDDLLDSFKFADDYVDLSSPCEFDLDVLRAAVEFTDFPMDEA